MKNAIKAEFRKLLSVRSTYIIVAGCLLITMLFAGYIEGVRASVHTMANPLLLAGESKSAALLVGLILAIAGLMLFGHEYRYNTIMYTLTSTNRRLKPYFAKVVSITVFSLVMGLVTTFFSPLCTLIGLKIGGHHLSPQTFDYVSIAWRCVFCVWGYAMYAFILVAIIRSQIGAIVTYLLIPLIGENILGALLKGNMKYLPFASLQTVAAPSILQGSTPGQSALISTLYVIVGIVVGAVLIMRRDAN